MIHLISIVTELLLYGLSYLVSNLKRCVEVELWTALSELWSLLWHFALVLNVLGFVCLIIKTTSGMSKSLSISSWQILRFFMPLIVFSSFHNILKHLFFWVRLKYHTRVICIIWDVLSWNRSCRFLGWLTSVDMFWCIFRFDSIFIALTFCLVLFSTKWWWSIFEGLPRYLSHMLSEWWWLQSIIAAILLLTWILEISLEFGNPSMRRCFLCRGLVNSKPKFITNLYKSYWLLTRLVIGVIHAEAVINKWVK
jgi:hypothetical protein